MSKVEEDRISTVAPNIDIPRNLVSSWRVTDSLISEFLDESLRIEGITRGPNKDEIDATRMFLEQDPLRIEHVLNLQVVYAPNRPLRDRAGMDVRVGGYYPPRGGITIPGRLGNLIEKVNRGDGSPWENHVAFEALHPFLDGNGRTGRAVWLWQMIRDDGVDRAFSLPFLHRFYYQTLDASDR